MAFHEDKDPRIIGKDGKQKAPEHQRNALKKKCREILRKPLKFINLLTLEDLLNINKRIKEQAKKDTSIEYGGADEYTTQTFKLKRLIESVPNCGVFEIAAYYLKNIILLQAFPDANHRTAFTAIEVFLDINNYDFDYTAEETYTFQTESYRRRLKIYKTYEEMPISILTEKENTLFSLCLEFVKSHAK